MKSAVPISLSICCLILTGCATSDPFVHTRLAVSQTELMADIDACQALSRSGGAGPSGVPYNPALGSQAGAALGAGFAQGLAQGRAQQVGYERCMADRGYLQTALTAEERATYGALRTVEAKKAWLAVFAAEDHGDRSVRRSEPECKPNLLIACKS